MVSTTRPDLAEIVESDVLNAGISDEDRSSLARALAFAADLYGGKLLGTGEPAYEHAVGTARNVAELRLDADARAAGLLFAVSPFAVLQPLAWLVRKSQYSLRYDWIYLALALSVTLLSERRQRKSFYYAGLLNTGAALYLIAEHRQWFDRPSWGVCLIILGLAALAAGFMLDRRSRTRRS